MPTDFKNVNQITQQVIDIVQDNSNLQNVWVRGKISNIRHIRNGPLNFILTAGNKSIECVIFNDRSPLQENLPAAGSNVSVKGQIDVYKTRSEYRFKVTDINLHGNSSAPQPVSVSVLTDTLETTLTDDSGGVQGEISNVYEANTGWTNFQLKDETVDGLPGNVIECSLPPSIANNLSFPLTEGEKVSVRGKFKIFSARNAYQIGIDNPADIVQVPKPPAEQPTTRCNGCGQYHDTNYELCPMCYYARLEHEGIVVGTVMRYFEKFKNFSTQREYSILLIGTIRGRADVVLKDSKNRLSAIAECKRIGYDGKDGIEQLKSYLLASDTKLGLFADDTDSYKWTFLKNCGKREFTEITRSEFEALIEDQEIQPTHEQSNQNPIPPTIPANSVPRFWQYITGVLGVALCICLTVLIMQLDEKNRKIQGNTRTITQLQNENKTLESEKQELQKQITEKDRQIQNSPQTISKLTDQNKTLVSKNRALQEQITEKDVEIKDNAGNILQLKNKIKDLQEKLDEKQAIIASYSKPGEQPLQNPDVEEPIEPEPPQQKPTSMSLVRLNINTATAKELDDLPVSGIGETLSERIIQYRKQNGNFATIDDITKVPGIGEKTLEKLRKFIYVE